MKTNTKINTNTETNVPEETSRFALGVGMVSAAMIGVWGVACMIGGLNSVGVVGMTKGFFTAIGVN